MRKTLTAYKQHPSKMNALIWAFDLRDNYQSFTVHELMAIFGEPHDPICKLIDHEVQYVLESNDLATYSRQAEIFNLVGKDNYLYHACGLVGEVHECLEEPIYDELGDVFWYSAVLINSLKVAFPNHIAFVRDYEIGRDSIDANKSVSVIAQACNKLYRKKDADKYLPMILSEIPKVLQACRNRVMFLHSSGAYQTDEEVKNNNIKKLLERYKK